MNVFINECSFRGQFRDREALQGAIARFLGLVERARKFLARRGGRMWRSDRVGDAKALEGETLHQTINHVAGRELGESFTDIVYNRANPAPWEPERAHQSDDYYACRIDLTDEKEEDSDGNGECVTDTSMAELAELRLRDITRPGCLLNLEGSALQNRPSVDVVKERRDRVSLSSFEVEAKLAEWLRGFDAIPPYEADATDPPSDAQTCLVDRIMYAPTSLVEQGRRVYQHKARQHYVYVDNLHVGAAAHLEVFDKRGLHIGEASLAGEIDRSKKDTEKRIKP